MGFSPEGDRLTFRIAGPSAKRLGPADVVVRLLRCGDHVGLFVLIGSKRSMLQGSEDPSLEMVVIHGGCGE